MSRRALAGVLAATVLLGSLPGAALAASPRASLPDIEDEVMCPVCGTPLNISEAPQAEREREFIRTQIARGQTKEQIKRALVAEYGTAVLAVPDDEGVDLAAWAVPAAALLLAALSIALALPRWRRRRPAGGGAERAPVAELGAADANRLERDLARYDR